MSKMKLEVTLCIENYKGKVTRYGKKDITTAEKAAKSWALRLNPHGFIRAVWIETREVMPAVKLEGSEVRA